jgi:hypothetical protein
MKKLMTVDFISVVCELRAMCVSWTDFEKAVGIPESTLRGYVEFGSHPPHWRGEIIISFWCRQLKRRRDDLPMTEVYIAPRISVPRQTRDRLTA